MIKLVAFDADDTLWHNEPLFTDTTSRFRQLLSAYHSPQWIEERLFETEMRNLHHYGYGIKSFTLSMIETAIELTEGRISGTEVGEILTYAKDMLRAPVRLLDDVEETVRQLAQSYQLMIVTKGDLFDQESKIARSGLGEFFSDVEVVVDKDQSTYDSIASKHGIALREFVMIGDSLRSDVLPVIQAGGHAIHVPYATVWQHEHVAEAEVARHQFARARGIAQVPELLKRIAPDG